MAIWGRPSPTATRLGILIFTLMKGFHPSPPRQLAGQPSGTRLRNMRVSHMQRGTTAVFCASIIQPWSKVNETQVHGVSGHLTDSLEALNLSEFLSRACEFGVAFLCDRKSRDKAPERNDSLAHVHVGRSPEAVWGKVRTRLSAGGSRIR